MNKRFDDLLKRIDSLERIMLAMFAGLIALVVAVIGFAWSNWSYVTFSYTLSISFLSSRILSLISAAFSNSRCFAYSFIFLSSFLIVSGI